MRRSGLLLGAALLALTAAPLPGAPAAAGCVGPSLEAPDPLVLERGTATVIEGRSFTAGGCQDSMSCPAFGCGSCEYDDPPPRPMADVEPLLRQRGQVWSLGTADAGTAEQDRLGRVEWRVEVPAEVERGRATLLTDASGPVAVRVR
ncbi:hypothetical protein [Nocardioides sp. SYSU DS0663]|uniref:hypothetical protein n=1 Tax=Nocardioides sp. SYSU DS0663 TaxID=3416445 RepID=UPI003F4C57DA